MEITLVILGLIFIVIGVIFIYDARLITNKMFSTQDVNDGVKALKIFGFVISILGFGIIYMCFPVALEKLFM